MVGIKVLDRFFKVVDIFLKAPNAKFFGSTRHLASTEGASFLRGGGGLGGCSPRKFFKIEHSETLFSAFLEPEIQFPRKGWSSLKF